MRRIRVRAGFKSQQAAADAIGCERGTVGMWEAPSSPVSAVSEEYLFDVGRAYKVRPDWINDLQRSDDDYPCGAHRGHMGSQDLQADTGSLSELPGWDNLSAMSQKNLGRVVAALEASGERKELFLQRLADVLERKTQAEMNLETQPISGERLALVNLVSFLAGQLTEEQAVTVQSVFGSFVALGAAKEAKEKSATKKVYKVMESTRSTARQVSAAERIKAGSKTAKGSR